MGGRTAWGPMRRFFFANQYSRRAMPILIELICHYSHFMRMARPQFRSTAEQREWVMLFAFAGMSRRDIALDLRIDVKTLAQHFSCELRDGPTIIREQLVAALEKAAAEGTNSARYLLAMMNNVPDERQSVAVQKHRAAGKGHSISTS
jgi:hypothetical protein